MRALLGNPDSTHPKSALRSGGFAAKELLRSG
jgi:hypothetical protein